MRNLKLRAARGIRRVAWLALIAISIFTAGVALAAGGGQSSSPVIYSVSITPAKVVAGEMIQMEAAFSAFDESARTSLPVSYFYEIRRQGEIVYKSPVKEMAAVNGAKTHLGINIQAAGAKGRYTASLQLIQSEKTAGTEAHFSIVSAMEARQYQAELREKDPSDANAPENRLIGEWAFMSQSPEAPVSRLTLSKANGELTARVTRENTDTIWVKLRQTENSLVIRSKSSQPGGDCWYVMEDVITFNDRMTQMPVRSRILDGSRCVSVGRAFESTLGRGK